MDAVKARQTAIGWLARREHSRAEVMAKLARKGCASDVAEGVVAVLTAQELLSDERFAESLVRSRRRRGYGPARIRKELEEKGLENGTVARWLDARNDDWLAELERVRRKKFGRRAPRSYEERAKQIRFLQYRGFTYDQIQQALNSRAAD